MKGDKVKDERPEKQASAGEKERDGRNLNKKETGNETQGQTDGRHERVG